MKKLVTALFSLVLFFAFAACSSSPKSAMEKYGNDLRKGNLEAFVNGMASKAPLTASEKSEYIALVELKILPEYEKKGGIKDFKVVKEEFVQGDSVAIVSVQIHFGDGSVDEDEQKMILQDGKWKMATSSK